MHYPHYKYIPQKQEATAIDRLMSIAAVVHPLTATPQVYSIYTTRDVSGVSLWTWVGFIVLGMIFLAYGILHKIKPFIITQVLWFAIDLAIVIGVLLYGKS
jgi:uncharacterized protein with PQ loop repeat